MIGFKLGLPELLILLCIVAFIAVVWAKIFSKAGLPGILCLLMFIPLINAITLVWFAFSEWPIERRLRGTGQPMPPPSL